MTSASSFCSPLRRRGFAAVLVAVSLVASPVAAKPKQRPNPQAVAAFEEGQERFSSADYEGALEAFRRAGEIQPAPALDYNIGLCYLRLERYELAIESLEAYLREADPPDRADVEYMIEDARRKLDEQRRAAEEAERAAAAEEAALDDDASSAPAPPERSTTASKPYRPLVIAGGTLLGAGVAVGLAGGLAFGLAIDQRNETIEAFNESWGTSGPSLAEVLALQDEAHRFEAAQFAMIGIGVALAAGGAVALGIGLHRKAKGAPATALSRASWRAGSGRTPSPLLSLAF